MPSQRFAFTTARAASPWLAALFTLCAACGGGGGDSGASPAPAPPVSANLTDSTAYSTAPDASLAAPTAAKKANVSDSVPKASK